MKNKLLLVLVAMLLASGCIVPIPHSRRVSPVFTGRFVDMTSQQPLTGVRVCVYGHPKTMVMSNAAGDFRVGPASRFKWGYLWTPPLTYDLPGMGVEFEHRIQIQDTLYHLASPLPDFGPQYPVPTNGVINLGILKLKPTEVQPKPEGDGKAAP